MVCSPGTTGWPRPAGMRIRGERGRGFSPGGGLAARRGHGRIEWDRSMSETATRPSPRIAAATGILSATSITAFAERDWDRLAPGMMARHAWLWVLERAVRRGERPGYLVIAQNGRPVAAAVIREVTAGNALASPDHLLFGPLRRPLARLGISCTPCLMVAPHKNCDPAILGDRRGEMIDALVHRATTEGRPLVLRGVPAADRELHGLLAQRGFASTLDEPVSYIDIAWSDFDGYLEALRARSRSLPRMVRKEIRKALRSGVAFREIHDPEPLAEELHAVAEAHHRRLNPGVPYPYDRCLLPLLKDRLGDRCILDGAFAGGRLLGFALTVHDGRVGHMAFAGFREEARQSLTYFNLAYYRPIDHAIVLGLERLYGGILQWRVKARRGFSFLPTTLHYRAPGGLGNLVARPLLRIHRWLAEHHRLRVLPDGAPEG